MSIEEAKQHAENILPAGHVREALPYVNAAIVSGRISDTVRTALIDRARALGRNASSRDRFALAGLAGALKHG